MPTLLALRKIDNRRPISDEPPISSAEELSPPPEELLAPALPLLDWVRAEAAFYRGDPQDGSALIAAWIDRAAGSIQFWKCQSVRELIEQSPRFRRCDLAATIELPPRSGRLATSIDEEVAGYLSGNPGDARRLLAWWLAELSGEADYYRADTEEQFHAARAAEELWNLS
jgi:hypothetical protein